MPDSPLKPDELATYKTDVATEAESPDGDAPTPGEDARPWMGFGLALLAIFVLAMTLAVIVAVR